VLRQQLLAQRHGAGPVAVITEELHASSLGHHQNAPEPALPDALEPGFHCARTHWIPGFMAFQPARRTRIVMLMVPA
jgi:hypothetical protein